MKGILNRKITVPGSFIGHSGTPVIGCSYKAAAGHLYPLERGFIYVHKPPIHIRFEEIASVNFARGGGTTRSFDFEVETKNGVVHTFSSIEKEEYGKLYDFITSKKLRVKNTGRSDKGSHGDDFGGSDEEEAPDAYLARVKAEGKERDAEDDSSGDSDSDDDDFKPGEESDVAEEFDSNVGTTDSEASAKGSGSGGGSGDDSDAKSKKKKKEKKVKKEKKEKKSKSDEKAPRKRKTKKEKDDNKPKRPQSSYMLWLSDTRDQIKKDFPGISITELTKKAGEMWKKVEDRSIWEAKAAKAKEAYEVAMKEYKATGGGAAQTSKVKEKSSKPSKVSPVKSSPSKPGDFKSKEYISTDESSSDGDTKSKKAKKPEKKVKKEESDEEIKTEESSSDEEDNKKRKKPTKKTKKEESEEEEEMEESDPESSEHSDSD